MYLLLKQSLKSSLFTWGGGKYGKLGVGGEANQLIPQPIPEFMRKNKTVLQAKCGLHHTVAVTEGGTVYAWGYSG